MSPNPVYTKEVAAVMLLREDGDLLMQLRDDKPGLPYAGMWSIPSGLVEPNESAEACARREMTEETGYRCGDLNHLVTMSDRDDTRTDYKLTIFRSFYDGKQELICLEGQKLSFIKRSSAPSYAMPGFIGGVWDTALKEFLYDGTKNK